MALVYIYTANDYVIHETISDDIIILSPSLYWYKKCVIPTRNFSKAKNIALHMVSDKPATFKEVLLYRSENDYDVYAYNKEIVKNLLKKLKLQNPKVYFANQLTFDGLVSIDSEKNLYKFNDRTMETVANATQKPDTSLTQSYKELLNEQSHIKLFEKSTNNNTSFLVASFVFFFLFIVFSSVDKIQSLNKLDKEFESLQTKDRSFYAIKSLIKKYKKLQSASDSLHSKVQNGLKQTNLKTLTYENSSVKTTINTTVGG
ncbi:hypothetical protein JHD48_06545 [Sulfurimonas sp. SAG-AH-194-I05]|nr:hypothetical protein [Sulfurimonas sp. SAG-AH-194-I05]MDF1875387.1 hypothetical protein [Sulfurimonas sp. SAG-AH-194-I05]